MRACIVLVALALWSWPALSEARGKRLSLGKLVQRTLSPRTSMFSLARYLGCRARKPAKVTFSKEAIDDLHPGLSLPGDLPRDDWPDRAVIASEGRLWRVPFRLRLVTEMAVLKDARRRKHLLRSRDGALVVVLTVKGKKRDTRITPRRVAWQLRRLGVSVYLTSHLAKCDHATRWCFIQTYYVRARRGRRAGSVVLELSAPADDPKSRVRGIKIVRLPKPTPKKK